MIDIIQILRREFEEAEAVSLTLLKEIARSQDRLKLATEKAEQIKRLIATYEFEAKTESEAGHQKTLPLQDLPTNSAPRPREPAQGWGISQKPSVQIIDGKSETKIARMLKETTAILALRGSVHRKHILEHLMEKGIMGHEGQPLSSLGVFLWNHKDKFMAEGGGHYRLCPPPAAGRAYLTTPPLAIRSAEQETDKDEGALRPDSPAMTS